MRTPSPADRPSLASARRRNWRVWLLQEWGLLLLAAALAILIWEITSRRVVKDREIEDVEVRLEVAEELRDRVGAVLAQEPTRIDVQLVSSERERNEAREALDVGGRPVVVLRITEPPPGSGTALNASRAHYAWPFPNHERILRGGEASKPAGRVFHLEPVHPRVDWPDRQHGATVPSIADLAARGIGVEITPSLEKVSVLAPRGEQDQPGWAVLEPDPVDLRSLVGDADQDASQIPFDQPLEFPLRFEAWREGGSGDTRNWRRHIELQEIRATIKLTQLGQRELQNRLIVQLPDEYKDHLDRQATRGVTTGGKLEFKGKLRGPKRVLDQLAADPGGWAWGIEIKDQAELPDGTMSNGGAESKVLKARFFWFPTRPEYRDRGIVFDALPGQDEFDLKVSYHPRK